jgi:hypothetical protein
MVRNLHCVIGREIFIVVFQKVIAELRTESADTGLHYTFHLLLRLCMILGFPSL